jgi:hypothetical protein
MNRIKLRLYAPPAEDVEQSALAGEPRDILPFGDADRSRFVFSGRFERVVDRARLIRDNSTCPTCERHDIEPLELDDADVSARGRLPIPGTATLVGFHCNDCGVEWPVYELTRRNG